MIGITFRMGGEMLNVEIDGNNLLFCDLETNLVSPIDGLRLSRAGVIKEFPDLEFDNEWRAKAIKRFKETFYKLPTEAKKSQYIINELKKVGYTPLYKQVAGFRPEVIK
jgi:hypothetical protein